MHVPVLHLCRVDEAKAREEKGRDGKRRDKNLAAHPKNGRGLMLNPRVNGACLGETVRLRFTLSLLLSPIYDTPYAPQFIVPSSDIKERSLSRKRART